MKTALDKYLPEQRIYIRTDRSTKFLTLKPKTQMFIGLLATASFSWMIIATAILGYNTLEARSDSNQANDQKQAYEMRINKLSKERDNRALEAQAAQEQFYVALNQISQQQTDLLNAEEQRRELATGLKIVQTKLQTAIKSRDVAVQNSDNMLAELQDATGNKSTGVGAAEEMGKALSLLSEELSTSADERKYLAADAAKSKKLAADLQFNTELAQLKNDQIFSQLEDAVAISLSPLERALKKSGINTEALLKTVRQRYSGSGGPLTELTVSTKGVAYNPDSRRAYNIMKSLDRVELLKIAGNKVPLSMPVLRSFRYTSGFGTRRDPFTGKLHQHNGTDFAAPIGTPIVATADGVIEFAGRQRGYGNLVKIRHLQGFETFYAHLSRIYVKVGQKVSRGDKIAAMGSTGRSTGSHLHYEIRIGGKPVNAIPYIKAANDVF